MTEREILPYQVGALMYVPALNITIGEKLVTTGIPCLDALALCLEDAITPHGVREAEAQLEETLSLLARQSLDGLPLLFVRVRDTAQLRRLAPLLRDMAGLLTGVIFPKFDLTCAAEYFSLLLAINASCRQTLYAMPVLETHSVMDLSSRQHVLPTLRELLDGYREYVLNVRVGAMDFCHLYGLRRTIRQSIYDIGVVRSALVDILTVFANDYVVSAPVWEYFGGAGDHTHNADWVTGLENELELDFANGFIGKTVIHPSQLPVVRRWLQPAATDYADALAVLHWSDDALGVAKSVAGNRMNEVATHSKWARKIQILAEIYGVRESRENCQSVA